MKRTRKTTPDLRVVVAPYPDEAPPVQVEMVINHLVDLTLASCPGPGEAGPESGGGQQKTEPGREKDSDP